MRDRRLEVDADSSLDHLDGLVLWKPGPCAVSLACRGHWLRFSDRRLRLSSLTPASGLDEGMEERRIDFNFNDARLQSTGRPSPRLWVKTSGAVRLSSVQRVSCISCKPSFGSLSSLLFPSFSRCSLLPFPLFLDFLFPFSLYPVPLLPPSLNCCRLSAASFPSPCFLFPFLVLFFLFFSLFFSSFLERKE